MKTNSNLFLLAFPLFLTCSHDNKMDNQTNIKTANNRFPKMLPKRRTSGKRLVPFN